MNVINKTIAIDGLNYDMDLAGPEDGPLVLLLHGFPQSKHAWRHELPALAAAGYRAVAPNQRGYSPGARPLTIADYAVKFLVDDVFAFADALGAYRFHLVGHDWGGALSWLAAAKTPERLLTLSVLSRPHPDAFARALDETEGQAHRSRHHKAFLNAETEQLLLADDARRFRAMLASHNCPEAAVAVYLRLLGEEAALGAALNWYRAAGGNLTARSDRAATGLGPVTVPTLYIWGDEDGSVGPEAAHWTADYVIGPYTFHRLEGVGHFITDERPNAIQEPLLRHLAQTSGD
jgi:pimeloyl-ACP methyl ester carboxylesterase